METRLVEIWVKCETGVYAENTGTTPSRLQIQLAVILEADMLVSSMTEVIVQSGQTFLVVEYEEDVFWVVSYTDTDKVLGIGEFAPCPTEVISSPPISTPEEPETPDTPREEVLDTPPIRAELPYTGFESSNLAADAIVFMAAGVGMLTWEQRTRGSTVRTAS